MFLLVSTLLDFFTRHTDFFNSRRSMHRFLLPVLFCLTSLLGHIKPIETFQISDLTGIELEEFPFLGESFQLLIGRIQLSGIPSSFLLCFSSFMSKGSNITY